MKLASALIAASVLAGCGGGGGTATTGSSPGDVAPASSAKVDRAAAVANAIKADPSRADEVLRQHGMTEKEFEDLMYEIAADPALSEAYNAKVGR